MRQQIDKMYLKFCKKYGLDPEKTLNEARFRKETKANLDTHRENKN